MSTETRPPVVQTNRPAPTPTPTTGITAVAWERSAVHTAGLDGQVVDAGRGDKRHRAVGVWQDLGAR